MADYRDTPTTDDELMDSIKLKELEPMSSSPYIHITLEEDQSSKPTKAPAQRRQGGDRAEYEARRRAEAQKKARRKQERDAEVARRGKAASPSVSTRPDPALRVIIEHPPEPEVDELEELFYDREQAADRYRSARQAQSSYPVDPYNPYGASAAPMASPEQFASQYPAMPNAALYGSGMPANASIPTQSIEPHDAPLYQVQDVPSEQYFSGQVGPGQRSAAQTEPINAAAVASVAAGAPFAPASYGDGRTAADASIQSDPVEPAPSRTQTIKPLMPSITLDSGTISSGTEEAAPAPQESVIIDAETNSKIVKRPWNSSALAEHSAAANEAGSTPSTPATKGSFEVRPFTDLTRNSAPAQPQTHRGMGSWKASALGAQPYTQTFQPEQNATQGSTDSDFLDIKFNLSDEGHLAESGNFKLDQKTMDDFGIGPTRDEPEPQSAFDQIGSPLLDEAALEESSMFEEPPVSLVEGMKSAEGAHKRRRHGLVVGLLITVIALLVAVICFLLFAPDSIGLKNIFSGESGTQSSAVSSASSSSTQSSSAGSSSSSSRSSSSSSSANLSGTVIYEYTAFTSSNVEYKVHDTVTYGSDGKCLSTEMQLQFPDAEAADAFLANLSRDYGSAYTLDSSDGANATVTIDISSLKMDREEYEDALRYSVEDLVILKK